MTVFGRAYIHVDNELINTESEATLDLGGIERTPVMGNDRKIGDTEKTKPSELTCKVRLVENEDLIERMRNKKAVDITFETDTGHSWLVPNASLQNTLKLDTENGVDMTFIGDPATATA